MVFEFKIFPLLEFDVQTHIESRPRGRRAQMKTMRGAVHIVEDIINTGINPVKILFGMTHGVRGGETPNLISLTIAVNLVIALA